MEPPVESRIGAAVAGDTAALTELLRNAAPDLAGHIHIPARWQSVLSVDDILQVTFMEAFLRIGSYTQRGSAGLEPWLRTIADNNLRDAVRGLERKKRPPPVLQANADDGSMAGLLEQLGVTTTTPSRVAAGRELTAALLQAIDLLPEDYAQVIRSYDLGGCTIDETARRAGRSRGAVHMLRARAHALLRDLLATVTDVENTGA